MPPDPTRPVPQLHPESAPEPPMYCRFHEHLRSASARRTKRLETEKVSSICTALSDPYCVPPFFVLFLPTILHSPSLSPFSAQGHLFHGQLLSRANWPHRRTPRVRVGGGLRSQNVVVSNALPDMQLYPLPAGSARAENQSTICVSMTSSSKARCRTLEGASCASWLPHDRSPGHGSQCPEIQGNVLPSLRFASFRG